jgi:hypothetical protein
VNDPQIHIASDLNLDGAVRNMVASAFGAASDLPSTVTTACGLRVPRGNTSRLPDESPAWRAASTHKRYLDHANQIELSISYQE